MTIARFKDLCVDVLCPSPMTAFWGRVIGLTSPADNPNVLVGDTPGKTIWINKVDEPRLAAFERVLFECARPPRIVITTPNAEYNVRFATLPAGQMRHKDHRFEWTRAQFETWAHAVAERFGYTVAFKPIGTWDEEVGAPTQMGVFTR